MPRAARICNKTGCADATTNTSGYCDTHQRPAWQGSTRNQKNPPGWQRIRQHILHRDNNLCQYCKTAPATDIDHIIPVSQGGSHKPNNLIASCKTCNQNKNITQRNTPTPKG